MVRREPFHPSLGNPGDTVHYFPHDLTKGHNLKDLVQGAVLPTVTELQSDDTAPRVTVSVPPPVVPMIFAHRAWRAGMLLADAIFTSRQGRPLLDLGRKKVIELGAGTAFPSILAAVSPAERAPDLVVCTDYNEPVLLDRLRHNVRANTGTRTVPRLHVAGYTWGTDPSDLLDLLPPPLPAAGTGPREAVPEGFDCILLADCLWDALSHEALLESLCVLLARNSSARVYVVAGLHTGRETLVAFMHRAHRAGLGLMPWLRVDDQGAVGPAPRPTDSWAGAGEPDGETDANEWSAVLEAELAPDAGLPARTPPPPPPPPPEGALVSVGARLTGRTRPFVLHEREEERRERAGVQERNRWMTFWALGWAPQWAS